MPKDARTYYYGVYDPTHTHGAVFTKWDPARERLDGIRNQTGHSGLVKKFAHFTDAEYFVKYGCAPPPSGVADDSVPAAAIVVYTDGSCRPNARGETCAGIGVYFGPHHPLNVAAPFTTPPLTNNRAELTAIYAALQIVANPDNAAFFPADKHCVCVYTDSSYARDSLGAWRKIWERTNFNNNTIMNRDVIEPIWKLMDTYTRAINITWNKAHCGIQGNEMADALANQGALRANPVS